MFRVLPSITVQVITLVFFIGTVHSAVTEYDLTIAQEKISITGGQVRGMTINGNIPGSWRYDPKTIRYLHGGAICERKAKSLVRSIIDAGGKEALQVADKPELEKLFVEFARS